MNSSAKVPNKVRRCKIDSRLFVEELKKRKISRLYHFTDCRNLNSIIECGGLWSWHSCQIHGVSVPAPGGNSASRNIDEYHGLHKFVRLSFIKDHPMKYVAQQDGRLQECFVIEISKDVISWEGTMFCNDNALRTGAKVLGDLAYFRNLPFDLMCSHDWGHPAVKRARQSEVLVPGWISDRYFLNRNELLRTSNRTGITSGNLIADAFSDDNVPF